MSLLPRRDILKLGMAGIPGAALLAHGLGASETPPNGIAATGGGASVCFRIGVPIWINETRFTELLDLFDANKGVTDEITLFTSETHPPLPLAVMRERMTLLAARMELARTRGYRSGINILATVGHHEENLDHSLSAAEFTPMTGPNGETCRGSLCPNSPELREYIMNVYMAATDAKPDYLWIDDDVRLMGHMPILECCFCDRCMELFSKRSGRLFTRDTLREALGGGTLEERLALRRAFLQHNRDTLSDLFTFIEAVVHGKTPGLPIGFMTGDRFYEGYGFDEWAKALAGPKNAPVYWRPGGGAYQEQRLDDFTDKAHAMGRQISPLPATITCIQSEVESFPYQRLKKSARATAMEASAYIAAGCTGAAFNVMSQYDEPLGEFAPLVAELGAARPFLDMLARSFGRTAPSGIHSGWNKDLHIAVNPEGNWFGGWSTPGRCNEIWATGLPAAYSAAHAPVTALTGDMPLALSDAELRDAFAKGLYLDGPALERLNAMGYGELTGFTVDDVRHIDCIEELTAHWLNGSFAGRRRNGRQSFWKCPAYFLHGAEGAESVARCVDYTYAETAPCCMGLYENKLGGRVCVAGYYPWEQLQTLSKSSQLKSVLRWLSKDTLPAYIASFHRIHLWAREREDGGYALALLNAYLDPALEVEVCVRTQRNAAETCDMRCKSEVVRASGVEDTYTRFVVPRIAPWEMMLVTV